jgi:tetratricopeptide (TPR) repeat protein
MLKKYRYALSDYSKCIEYNDAIPGAYNNRGSLYKTLKKYEAAIADFNRTLELDPHYEHAYNGRGLCYKELGRLEDAKADLDTALKLVPGSLLFLLNLATIYLAMSDQQKAKEVFDQSLGIFDEGNAAELKKKYQMTDKTIEFIKKSINTYRKQEKELEELECLSKEQGRDDILEALPRLEELNKLISIKSMMFDNREEIEGKEEAKEKTTKDSEITVPASEESMIMKEIALMKR